MGAGRQGRLGRLSWRALITVVAAVALRRAAQKKRPQRGGHAEAVISSDAWATASGIALISYVTAMVPVQRPDAVGIRALPSATIGERVR